MALLRYLQLKYAPSSAIQWGKLNILSAERLDAKTQAYRTYSWLLYKKPGSVQSSVRSPFVTRLWWQCNCHLENSSLSFAHDSPICLPNTKSAKVQYLSQVTYLQTRHIGDLQIARSKIQSAVKRPRTLYEGCAAHEGSADSPRSIVHTAPVCCYCLGIHKRIFRTYGWSILRIVVHIILSARKTFRMLIASQTFSGQGTDVSQLAAQQFQDSCAEFVGFA